MSTVPNGALSLDALLSALEDDVLKLEDGSILSEECDSLASIRQLRAMIETQIDAYSIQNASESSPQTEQDSSDRPSTPRAAPFAVPKRASARRIFLERLVSTRTYLPYQVRTAFSGGRAPSDTQIEKLIEQLVHLRICKSPNDGK